MLCYIIMTVLGACLIAYGVKKSKIILIGGALLAAAGLFLVICTILLAYSVSHSEPNPAFDYEDPSPVVSYIEETEGSD